MKDCVFKKNNYEDLAEGVWVRISPAILGMSIMGRASSGVDRRGGRKKGKELVCRWREEQVG